MSKTIKVASQVFAISFIPIAIYILIGWEGFATFYQLIYTFLLMIGFMGVPIYLMTLLYQFIVSKSESSTFHWKYGLSVNLLIFVLGIYSSMERFSGFSWNSIAAVTNHYIDEYIIINLIATVATILIPYVYHKSIAQS